MKKEISTHAAAAKAIKAELKKLYPNIKFSIKSLSYSGGDHVTIDYYDGVQSKEINNIVNKYEYGSFDGMNDIYNNDNVRNDIPQVKYIIVQRHFTEQTEAIAIKEFETKYNEIYEANKYYSNLGGYGCQLLSKIMHKNNY